MAVSDPANIRALTTRFRLKHVATGCYLRSEATTLPQWGFKQSEVTCQKKTDPMSAYNMWNVENHWNDKLPQGSKFNYKSNFFRDVLHLNVAMWTTNNALTPDPEKEPDTLTSQPWEWPMSLTGLRICSWGIKDVKYYLLGNPLIWWGSFLSLFATAGIFGYYGVRFQRKYKDHLGGFFISYSDTCVTSRRL